MQPQLIPPPDRRTGEVRSDKPKNVSRVSVEPPQTGDSHQPLSPRETLLLILLPLLGTFACQRLYLHLVQVQHIYPGGYLLHHLFTGVLIVIPAAFLLAFGTHRRFVAIATRVALGIGSAMILDEIVYLVATKATDEDYVSRVSLYGAVAFISLAIILLCLFYRLKRRTAMIQQTKRPNHP